MRCYLWLTTPSYKYKITKAEVQKEVQKETNELKLKKEAGEIKPKAYATEEAILMKKIDDLDAEFDDLKEKLKLLNV